MADTLDIVARLDADGLKFRETDHAKLKERYAVGSTIILSCSEPRSMKEHRFFFAALGEAFTSLPEALQDMPYARNFDCFRKHGLIAKGHHECSTLDCGTVAAAERMAAFIPTVATDYLIVRQRGPVVIVNKALSQSVRAMGAETFRKSKTDVLEWAEEILGLDQGSITGGLAA